MGNWRLWSGCLITGLLLIIALAGPAFAPYDSDFQEPAGYVETDDGKEMMGSPFPPSEDHWLGTDEWGYDILSMLLYGAKYTFFTAVFTASARVLIGGSAGLIAGMGNRKVRTGNGFGLLGSIPAFLIFILSWLELLSILHFHHGS